MLLPDELPQQYAFLFDDLAGPGAGADRPAGAGDFDALARKLKPAITAAQARKAVRVLVKTGLISQGPDGVYRKADAFVKPTEWDRAVLPGYQLSVMDLARGAFDRFEAKDRDISSLTLGLSGKAFARIKEEIAQFRSRLMDIARGDEKAGAVYQFNFQGFPLTEVEGEGDQ
jgi:uncharacterized protein (TIGR02147 family)